MLVFRGTSEPKVASTAPGNARLTLFEVATTTKNRIAIHKRARKGKIEAVDLMRRGKLRELDDMSSW